MKLETPLGWFLGALSLASLISCHILHEDLATSELHDRVSEEPEIAVGGPTAEVQDLWAVVTEDDEVLAVAVNQLVDWFKRDGEPLLDRSLDYSFIESVSLDDLRARDVVGLADVGWDPLQALGTNREGLDAHLEKARGLLATSVVACGIEAVVARRYQQARLQLVETTEAVAFADQVVQLRSVRGSRTAELDIDGALTRVLVELRVQVAPVELGAMGAELKQRWQLDLWIERSETTTLRLRADWVEASSPLFGPDSRAWMGWVLHDAFEQAGDLTSSCSEELKAAPLEAQPQASPLGASPPPPASAASPSSSPRSSVPPARPVAPLCEGARLIQLDPWSLRLMKTEHALSALSEGAELTELRVDPGVVDSWLAAGVRSWVAVLGLDMKTVGKGDLARLQRLVARFGPEPRLFGKASQERFRLRWKKGLLREMLGKDPVLIPVCPSSLAYTDKKLMCGADSQQARRPEEIAQVTAIALLEHGSVHGVGDAEWRSICESFALGDSIRGLLNRGGGPIESVESNL